MSVDPAPSLPPRLRWASPLPAPPLPPAAEPLLLPFPLCAPRSPLSQGALALLHETQVTDEQRELLARRPAPPRHIRPPRACVRSSP